MNENALLGTHPTVLARLMERAWLDHETTAAPPAPVRVGLPRPILASLGGGALIDLVPLGLPAIGLPYAAGWDHLIYGYFVENTRAVEIFRRVVKEFASGERLSLPAAGVNDAAMIWLRTAEEMWFRDSSPFPIGNLISQMRPDFGATRRNAYFRAFGMDLNHGAEDGRPYAYEKSEAANRDFVRLFEDLLVQVWVARINVTNANGPNPTDTAAIARAASLLQELLSLRKQGGQLRREEFVIVSMMSWLHLTLTFDSPIVTQLSANATTPGERLIRLGQRVGIPAHPRCREFLDLAQDSSALLRLIESGFLNNALTVPWLYQSWSPVTPVVNNVVTLWSIVTGRDIKAMASRVAGLPQQMQLPPPSLTPVLAPMTNGALMRT